MNKTLLLFIAAFLTFSIAGAQYHNTGPLNNSGATMSDFGTQFINDGGGVYTGSNNVIFQHSGQSIGTFINSASYTNAVNATDNFAGPGSLPGTQEIGGTTAPQFYTLQLNNGSASLFNITNTGGAIISNNIAFNNGITTTIRSAGAAGALKMLAGSTYSSAGPGNARYVNGYVTKTGSTAFVYPVGAQSGTEYRPIFMNAPPTATDALSIAYYSGSPTADPTSPAPNRSALSTTVVSGATLLSVSPVGFWDWIALTGTDAISVTVSIPDMTGPGGYSTGTQMRLVGYNTATNLWELLGTAGASSNAAGSTLAGTVPDMSRFTSLGVGSISAVPLPLELTSFTALAAQCSVRLSWQTANERGIGYFAVQRSTDALSWTEVRRTSSAGTNTGAMNYQTQDEHPEAGLSYYRLLIAEMDGSSHYSAVLPVRIDCSDKVIAIAPNPVKTQFSIEGLSGLSVVKVFAADGYLVCESRSSGSNVTLDASAWAPGIYTVQIMDIQTIVVATRQVTKR